MQPDNDRWNWRLRRRKGWAIALLILLGFNVAWLSFGKSKTVAGPNVILAESVSSEIGSSKADSETSNETSTNHAESIFNASTYQRYELENATVHVVTVPPSAQVSITVADDLKTVRDFAEQMSAAGTQPQAILNGGFFDPNNGKTTSHIIVDAQNVGDPAENEGLTGNPKMQPYLPQIFSRSEFRIYDCPLANMLTPYAITAHDEPVPDGCNLMQAVGAGPQLLPSDTSEIEAFTQYEDGELVRDAIGSVYPNARSAIGIHEDGSAMLFMVAQRPDAPGLTLAEVADYAASLGVMKLLNLDGGSSSSLYYAGQLHLGRMNTEGEAIERPVKSVIVVK